MEGRGHSVCYSTDIYGISSVDDSKGKTVYFPYEIDLDGAPIGSPYAFFDTVEEAVECVKRIGGVLYDAVFAN